MALARIRPTERRQTGPRTLLLVGVAACLGLIIGLLYLRIGPIKVFGLALSTFILVASLRSLWVPVAAVIATISLLPFGVLPVHAGSVTPSLLEVALIAALVGYGVILLIDRRQHLRTCGALALWAAFGGYLVFAFVLGLGRGYTSQTLHNFFKFGLAMMTFMLVIQLVQRPADAILFLRLIIAGISAAAAIGLGLYAAGPGPTSRLLSQLTSYGYPASRIVRYIEDDPARPMRAVGTSVDPNALGGLLMVGFVLAFAQLLSRQRIMPVQLAFVATGLSGRAMLLTYSRGAWVGAFAGLAIVLWFRRKSWILPAFGLAAMAVLLGLGSGFIRRLWLGLTLQDPATKLRLQEYDNARAIIQHDPWFGVGFGDAPAANLQTGVSSIYLTVAEQAGLIGLALFLVIVGLVLWRAFLELQITRDTVTDDLLLSVFAAMAAMLTVGLVDHYFVNVQFAHMVALYWILTGLAVALTIIRQAPEVLEGTEDGTDTKRRVRASRHAL